MKKLKLLFEHILKHFKYKNVPVTNKNEWVETGLSSPMYTFGNAANVNYEGIIEWIYSPYHTYQVNIMHHITHSALLFLPRTEGIEIEFDMNHYKFKKIVKSIEHRKQFFNYDAR